MRIGIGGLIYLIIGIVLASTHHYLAHVATIKLILAALLAIVLWPLLLLGVNLHV